MATAVALHNLNLHTLPFSFSFAVQKHDSGRRWPCSEKFKFCVRNSRSPRRVRKSSNGSNDDEQFESGRRRRRRRLGQLNFSSGQVSSLFQSSSGKEADDKKEQRSLVLSSSVLGSIGLGRSQDVATVFVAGATGLLGSRISQRLLTEGFTIRAGVSDLSLAQQLAQFATEYKIISKDDAKRLNAVEFDIEDTESIAKAIGNAGNAVVSIGPAEDGPGSKVTTNGAMNVIEAAKLANVKHVTVVYEDEGVLGLLEGIFSFFSRIFGRGSLTFAQLLDRIVEKDISYTILRASVGDDFQSEGYGNLVLKTEGSADSNDKVSMAQMASLVAGVFVNTSSSENKTIEVSTSRSAPSKAIADLLGEIPVDGKREAFAEAQAKVKAEEEARIAAENERKTTALAQKLEADAQKLAERENKASKLVAQIKAGDAGAPFDYFINKAKEFGFDYFDGNAGSQSRAQVIVEEGENGNGSSKVPGFNKILGKWFKQETVYVDDD